MTLPHFSRRLLALVAALACSGPALAAAPPLATARPSSASATTATPVPLRDDASLHPAPWLAGVVQAPLTGPVTLYGPPSDRPVRGLALFLSGDGGWNRGVVDMARRAADTGLWVAGFSTPKYLHALATRPAEKCGDVAANMQALGAQLKQQLGLPADMPVVLIGYSSGATLVYAALVQARPQEFQGGLSLGFGPEIETRHAFCPGFGGLAAVPSKLKPHWPNFVRNAHVQAPWQILQGDIDEVVTPQDATEFASGIPEARAWILPHVGHGFGVPRNWAPQYHSALETLLSAAPPTTREQVHGELAQTAH